MTYVYDLILNFNNDLYEFYEWMKDDDIYHIKRINLVKVTSKVYNEILDNEVVFHDDFLLDIFNKCEYFEQKKVKSFDYAFLLTDAYRVMALKLNEDGKVIKYSSLLLDEEEDILEVSVRIPTIKLEYNIIDKRDKSNLTRKEERILKYIKKDLDNCYQNKNLGKLKYLYYEYFNRESNDLEEIYQSLYEELKSDINDKHYNLYNLIKLSYSNKAI